MNETTVCRTIVASNDFTEYVAEVWPFCDETLCVEMPNSDLSLPAPWF
jgi:hypothetical protein